MKKILVIGAGFLQSFIIRKAKKLGYYVLAIDGNPKAEGFGISDESKCINIVDEKACLEYARKKKIDGVITGATDFGVLSAAYIAQELGLPGLNYETACLIKNKYLVRKRLCESKVDDMAQTFEVGRNTEISQIAKQIQFPVMVKPCDGSGSRGTSKVCVPEHLEEACKCAIKNSVIQRAEIESFITGTEYGVESFIENDRIHVMAVMKKWMTPPPYYAELGHAIPAGISQGLEQKIVDCVKAAIQALGLNFGAVNMDVLVTLDGKVHIVDVGARMGGNLIGSHIVPLGTGVDYLGNLLKICVGDPIDMKEVCEGKKVVTRLLALHPGKIVSLPDINMLAKKYHVDIQHHLQVGDMIAEYHTNLDGCGYVIAADNDLAKAVQKAEDVLRVLNKEIERERVMQKLLLLGKAQANMEILNYAKNIGVYTIVAAVEDQEKCLAKKFADEAWMINTADIDVLEKKCIEEKITAVFCGISEFNIEVMIELGKRLNLPVYCDMEAWSYSRDKLKFRNFCEKVGVPMAKFYAVSKELKKEALSQIEYPVVVKPIDRNGNRGISFCYNEDELIQGYRKALEVSNSDKIVVEKMLRGPEYGIFYAIAEGIPSLVSVEAMCSEPGYPHNCYSFETTATRKVPHVLVELDEKLTNLLKEAGCRDGVAWFETILDEDGHFYILEMGHRMNGEMTFMAYPKAYGFDVVKWMVDFSLGIKHSKVDLPARLSKTSEISANVFCMWTKMEGVINKIEGIERLNNIDKMHISMTAQEGDHVNKFQHIGSVIFNSSSINETVSILEEIRKSLKILDQNGNEMIIKYTDYDCLGKI